MKKLHCLRVSEIIRLLLDRLIVKVSLVLIISELIIFFSSDLFNTLNFQNDFQSHDIDVLVIDYKNLFIQQLVEQMMVFEKLRAILFISRKKPRLWIEIKSSYLCFRRVNLIVLDLLLYFLLTFNILSAKHIFRIKLNL